MSARPFYETVYHRNDWTLADAFRPQPGWGSKTFTVPVAALGDMSEASLIAAAKDAAPSNHRLTKISLYPLGGDEQIIWSAPPDPRFSKKEDIDGEH